MTNHMKYHFLGEIFSVNQDWNSLSIITFNMAWVACRRQLVSCVLSDLLFIYEKPEGRNHFLFSLSWLPGIVWPIVGS